MCILLVLVNVVLMASGAAVATSGPTFDEWKSEQANETAAIDAEEARQAKIAAVAKVTEMLEDVQRKVMMEGEMEAKTYNEFACFCKDTIQEKTDAVKAGKDAKAATEAAIDELSEHRDLLDRKINKLEKDIEQAIDEIANAKDVRASELALYKSNAADLEAGIVALDGALKVLKESKVGKPAGEPSLVQLQQVGKTARTAVLIADALGLVKDPTSGVIGAFLQQAPEVEFENYRFHSSDIIATLEQLRSDFQSMKDHVDKVEVKSVAAHTRYLQDMDAKVKALQLDVEETRADKAETVASIKANSEQLTTVAAELLDDQQYLGALAHMCKQKKVTWDERSRVRADELHTLTQVIGIIKGAVTNKTSADTVRFSQMGVTLRRAQLTATDASAMDELEAEAEAAESAAAFVQMAQVHRHQPGDTEAGRKYVANMLERTGAQLKSEALTSLARTIFEVDGADPFAKVKQLIQELIERLLQQAANEANQKGWCDKATAAAEQKRTYATDEIMELNSQMAQLEALRDRLSEEIDVLSKEIEELITTRQQAEKIRQDEKNDNEATIEEARAGLEAVNMAIGVISKFYKSVGHAEHCDVDTVFVRSFKFPAEIHWAILEDGHIICGGSGYAGADTTVGETHSTKCCLIGGVAYTLACEDSFGNGWDGGYLTIQDKRYCGNFTTDFKPFTFSVDNTRVALAQQTPGEDAPDAGFDNFELYRGAQAEAGGILGMMDVIASDFTRTISETQKAEASAEEEHLEFMTETGKSLGEKKVVNKQKTTERDNALEDLEEANDKLQLETKTLQTAIKELIELKAACVDMGMSYDERVARREQEIEALKKALCILNAYQEYGPDGLADAC